MLICGLTGGSGSGKGYVAKKLEAYGAASIDTDALYHEMTSCKSKLTHSLATEYGADILDEKGALIRAKLSAIVFSDPAKLKRLNAITHPCIIERTYKEIERLNKCGIEIILIDAPLLFEADMHTMCDLTIGVIAPLELRINRIIKRDSITEEAAIKRISNQKENKFYQKNCDYVITNTDDGTLDGYVSDLFEELKRINDEKKTKEKE